jgi:aryl-alcohol dehydrogenase-like predicted oxidoreductase
METRRLGDTDLDLTVIGIGTWAIGGGDWEYGWGPQQEQDSIDSILEGLELGINWIDTAAAYGFGAAETAVGKALTAWGKPVFIATKCGILPGPRASVIRHISKKSILKEADASLKRLKADCIDLYQIHWPVPDENVEEAFEALLELKQQQKIRWAGVSNFSVAQMERCSRLGHVSSLQPPYSLLRREIESELLSWCRQNQCGVIVYSPMQCGLLTGKVTREWIDALPDSDWRAPKRNLFNTQFLAGPNLTHFLALVERLKEIASDSRHTPAQLAISWVLRREEVTAAIVGARRCGQIEETAKAAQWKLSDDELAAVEEAYARFRDKFSAP